jgi:dienelactone hydrolase
LHPQTIFRWIIKPGSKVGFSGYNRPVSLGIGIHLTILKQKKRRSGSQEFKVTKGRRPTGSTWRPGCINFKKYPMVFNSANRKESMSMRYFIAISLILAFPAALIGATGAPVTYQVQGEPYEGYYISPSKQAPLVILIHDWDGLTDYEIKRAHMLAELGYAVFALDLFGAGVRPTEVADRRQHTGELYKNREKMRTLMAGALDAAKDRGANIDNAVAAGYCFGGAAVLEWARSGANLKGFATFHGGLKTPEGQNYAKTRGEILIMHGSADSAITLDQFADLARELEAAGVAHEMSTYGGAQHAFTVFGENRYQEAADKKSWKRFQEFLAERLKGSAN